MQVGSLAAATGVAASAGGGVPAERIVDTGDGKLTVTETRDFAGQALTVTRTLDATSKEAKKLARKAGEAKTGGIDAVLMQVFEHEASTSNSNMFWFEWCAPTYQNGVGFSVVTRV